MQYIAYNENKQRGTFDFPFEFHHIDSLHPQYLMPYHWHVEYEIIRILSGSLTVTMDEQEFCAKAGDILFIGSGILHSGIPKDCVYECIVFDMNVFLKYNDTCKKQIQNILDHSILIYHHFKKDNRRVHTITDQIFDALANTPEGFRFTVLGGFYQFFGMVYADKLYLTDTKQTMRDHKRILQLKNVLEFIESNYKNAVSLEDLSKAADMSPKYFCRFFKAMTHKTPVDYLNRFRIDHACQLLLTTDLSVTEIAFMCGFSDLSYFIRLFKKYKNNTPKQYLRE